MGGENEGVLKEDKKASAAPVQATHSILQPDPPPIPPPAPAAHAQTIPQAPNSADPGEGIPLQAQAIRNHLSQGQIHFHCDAQNLKVAIPVAEWYVILRHLRSLHPFTWVDPQFKCVAYFRPYIYGGTFDVAVEMCPIHIGARFEQLEAVATRR
jgi:hypothetical protein